MNSKVRLVTYLAMAIVPAFGGLVLLAGCQKDKPIVGPEAAQTKASEATPAPAKQEAAPATVTQVAQAAEQTTCPVMGGPINKAIFVEYKGKKVYFCCNGCPATFQADPEKYISKLPQFAK